MSRSLNLASFAVSATCLLACGDDSPSTSPAKDAGSDAETAPASLNGGGKGGSAAAGKSAAAGGKGGSSAAGKGGGSAAVGGKSGGSGKGGSAAGGKGGADADAGTNEGTGGAPAAGSGGSGGNTGISNCTGTSKLDAFVSDPKLCVYTFASGVNGARGLAFASNGDLFVNNGQVTVLWDENGDGTSDDNERGTFGSAASLNHGIVFAPDEAYLYASSSTTIYRWPYSKGQRTASGDPEVVVKDIPGDGGHVTRTLVFDSQKRLYVSVGSASNLDEDPGLLDTRSQIRRYTIPDAIPAGGIAYTDGEKVATGMRNEVGLYIDAKDQLWGVENGRDNLSDDDLGGDIHNDNPGEELNLVNGQGSSFYGYPFCFSELAVTTGGKGAGTQWADQTVNPSTVWTDANCADPAMVHPPAYAMPAHWAPLGIIQYTGHTLPFTGDLLISAHGSWNRNPATGRVIARAHLVNDAVTDFTIIVGQKGGDGKLQQGNWNIRPVDIRQGPDEAVYVSDDSSGNILKIGYAQ